MRDTIDLQKFAASELFFLFGDEGLKNLLEVKQKTPLYSKAIDAYATGWIAKHIWNEEWDPLYFHKDNMWVTWQYANLQLKLESLFKEDLRERASIPDVFDTLRMMPYNWVTYA